MTINYEVGKTIANSKQETRKKVVNFLNHVFDINLRDKIMEIDIYDNGGNKSNIHAYARLKEDQTKIIHFKVFLEESDEQKMKISARLMDYDRLKLIRKRENAPAIGEEEQAMISYLSRFKNNDGELGIINCYDSGKLEEILGYDVKELRRERKPTYYGLNSKAGLCGFYR